jgi:hypothetical protein
MRAARDLLVVRDLGVTGNVNVTGAAVGTGNVTVSGNATVAQTIKGADILATNFAASPSFLPQPPSPAPRGVHAAGDQCNYPGVANGQPITIFPTGTIVPDVTGISLNCRVPAATPTATGIFVYSNGTLTPPP